MQELSTKWESLDTNTKQYIALTSSGANQIQNFYALMSNFGTAVDATNTAINASGSAWRENAKYMESIEAKTQKLKTAIQDLILGNGGLEKLIKIILDLSTNIVKLIDNAGGLTTIIGALSGALILLNREAVLKLVQGLFTVGQAVEEATIELKIFGTTVTTTNTAINATAGYIGILVLACTALVAVLSYVAKSNERTIKDIGELNQKIEIERNEIEEITNNLEKLKNRLNELKNIENPSLTDEKDIQNLNVEIHQLETELALKKKINEEDERTREKKASKIVSGRLFAGNKSLGEDLLVNEASYFKQVTGSSTNEGKYDTLGETYYQQVISYTDRLNAVKEKLNELIEENSTLVDENGNVLEGQNKKYEANNKKIEMANALIDSYDKMLVKATTELENTTEGLDKSSLSYQLARKAIDYYSESVWNSLDASEKQASSEELITSELERVRAEYSLTDDEYQKLQDTVEEAIANKGDEEDAYLVASNAINEFIGSIRAESDLLSDWNKQLDDLQTNYKTLSEAVEEYNANGGYSVDTVQKLLALSPEYLSMLVEENGQLKVSEEALKAKAVAIIEEAKAKIYEEGAERINQIAQRDSTATTNENTQAVNNNTEANLANAKSLYDMAKSRELLNNGGAWKEVDAIDKDVQKRIKTLDNLLLDLDKDFKKTFTDAKTSASQAKSEVNALKSSVEALKQEVSDMNDELDKYKKAISYIKGKLDEEIDSLKEQRDIEVQLLEDKIEALEDEKRLDEDRHKEEIRLLEEERDLIINTTKEQIETLKEKKEQEEEYWNNKIQALKDQNEALEEQAELEKLLLNLETAKNTKVRVYKKGQGFVWQTDAEAVKKAKKELDTFYRKKDYDNALKELENFKKASLDSYNAQIDDLNNYVNSVKNAYNTQIDGINALIATNKTKYDEQITSLKNMVKQTKSAYEEQIKYFEEYKKSFDKQLNAYEDQQSRLLTLQLTGIDFENQNWKTRLSNLDSFAKEYNNKLAELQKKQEELNALQRQLNSSSSSSSSGGNNNNGGSSSTTTTTPNAMQGDSRYQAPKTKTVYVVNGRTYQTYNEAVSARDSYNAEIDRKIAEVRRKGGNSSAIEAQVKGLSSQKIGISTKTVTYAKGTPSVKDDQIAIVGENPNKELVIGSKLNGTAMNLKKGTGVVNAKSTSTLAGLLNTLGGQLSSASTGNYNLSDNSTQTSQSIQIGNISLPQVRDANDFIDALSNFQNIMAQKAYSSI